MRLEDGLKRHQLVVTQYVPGVFEDNDSYRAEASGICAGFLLLRTICRLQNITSGSIKLGCDGQSALNKSTAAHWVIRHSDKHHDVLTAAQTFRNQLPIKINPIWIKGHQDDGPDGLSYCRMDRMTQLNVDCDKGAKALARVPPATPPMQVATELWTISVRGVQLVNEIEPALRKAIHDPVLLDYWHRHDLLSAEHHNSIDWAALQHAMRNTKHCRQKWVSKTFAEECGIGTKLVEWNYRDSAQCALCGAPQEDIEHMLHCPHPSVTDKWDKSMAKLNTFLQEQKTEDALREAILDMLKGWQSNPHRYLYSLEFDNIFAKQNQIGWKNFMFGFMAKEWSQAQQSYYESIASRRTGKRWVSALIRKLWDIAWDLWDHRNTQIHRPGQLDAYEDTTTLDMNVRTEFALGTPPNLPRRFRIHFRYTQVEEILALSNLDRSLWLKKSKLIRRRLPLAAERRLLRQWLNR